MHLQPQPLITAVICTRNRAESIAGAVASVLAVDDPHFELVVIDQSDTDSTRAALKELLADPRLRYVHTTRTGLSPAYNAAVAQSRGELLAFTDDDCIAPHDWLRTIRAEFDLDPEVDLIYGQVNLPSELKGVPGVVPSLAFPARRRLSQKDGFIVAGMGANFAARRRVFERVGGFDEVLGGGGPLRSAQDYDFQFRIFRASRVSTLTPHVNVLHYGHRTRAEWPATERAYGVGDGAFYMKHMRCGDLLAARLLARIVTREAARVVLKPVIRRRTHSTVYLRGILQGCRESFRFDVDRQERMYVAPGR